MPTTESPDAVGRMRRFAEYVQADPGNADLLADAWEAAGAAGDHAMALRFAIAGQRTGDGDAAAWLHRRAQSLIAAGELSEAASLLEQARARGMVAIVADHDLAWIAMQHGEFAACVAIAQPWLDAAEAEDAVVVDRLQAIWLRGMHRLRKIDAAWAWLETQERAGCSFGQEASAAASLLAVDADRFEAARTLSELALAQNPRSLEALTARGAVALAEGDVDGARRWLATADAVQPQDGRVQSALGLVELQAGRFVDAQGRFDRAVALLPLHIGSWHGLGWARLLQGQLPAAAAAFRHALDLDPAFGESQGAVGLALMLQGDAAGAEPYLRRAHMLDARNVTASFAHALGSGRLTPSQFAGLAQRLLDRPGFFGEKLSARWPLPDQPARPASA